MRTTYELTVKCEVTGNTLSHSYTDPTHAIADLYDSMEEWADELTSMDGVDALDWIADAYMTVDGKRIEAYKATNEIIDFAKVTYEMSDEVIDEVISAKIVRRNK